MFDLLLDFVVKSSAYNDTDFCIDEPEAHMNPRLQGALLQELLNLIPDNSQLWIGTHSIGMMRKARDIALAEPGQVVFLDFGDKDFDQPQVIEPATPDRGFWQKALSVAIDDLGELVAPSTVIICEGGPKTERSGKNAGNDARCYDTIFADEFPDAKFLSGGNSSDVETDRHAMAAAIKTISSGTELIRIIDLDDRTKEEVQEAGNRGVTVLSRRNLESYLFDNEVIQAICDLNNNSDATESLIEYRDEMLKSKETAAPNDYKKVRGEVFTKIRRDLGLVNRGNSVEAFMRDTLAPLVTRDMVVYQDLRQDIFGKSPSLRVRFKRVTNAALNVFR